MNSCILCTFLPNICIVSLEDCIAKFRKVKIAAFQFIYWLEKWELGSFSLKWEQNQISPLPLAPEEGWGVVKI